MQTYTDAVEILLFTSISLPPELLNETQNLVEANRKLGYTRPRKFIRDAIRTQLRLTKEQSTFVEIPKEEDMIKPSNPPRFPNTEFLKR